MYVFDLRQKRIPRTIGNKAENLRFLVRHGFAVPTTMVCTWNAYLDYFSDGSATRERLRAELADRLDVERLYAVRSSANVEDDLAHSFAGQFRTFLNLQGVDAILDAIASVWSTARSGDVQSYLGRHAIAPEKLRMAVIVQEMVHARVSGVSFSKNPVTGLDEVIVEAVEGSGEALVQGGITPRRWVNKWGTWLQRPDDDGIETGLIGEVVRTTKAIARQFGKAADLEWVYDGERLHWVQLREITALDIPIYSNRISREFFPGIIKPLIWSINVPLVNGAWTRLLTELIGPNDIDPLSLAGIFYYRAYFNMGALGQLFERLGLPRETLELLLGLEIEGPDKPSFRPTPTTYKLLPRMLRFAQNKLRFSRRLDLGLPSLRKQFQGLHAERAANLSEGELLEAIDRLFLLAQEAAYYDIVTPLLMAVYNRILKTQLRRAGVDFETLDITAGMEEIKQFEPGVELAHLHEQYCALEPAVQASLANDNLEEHRNLRAWLLSLMGFCASSNGSAT